MAKLFISGLSTGSACLVTCWMVIFPYILAGSTGVKVIATDIIGSLAARLFIYTILATLAWFAGQSVFGSPVLKNYVSGILIIF